MTDQATPPVVDSKEPTALSVDAAADKLGGIFAAIAAHKTSPEKTPPKVKADPTPADPAVEDEAEEPEVSEEAADSEEPDAEQPDEEPAVEEESDDAPASPKKVTVKVDGKDEEVEFEELKAGYSRTADYTRKAQALAADKKKFESEEVAKVREERQQYAEHLTQLAEFFTTANAEPNWVELRATLPADEFAARRADWDINKDRLEKVKTERAKVEAVQAADYKKQYDDLVAREADLLVAAKPEWKDPAVATREKAAIVKVATTLGYDEADLARVTDHRILLLLDKAARWDALQAKTPSIKDKIKQVVAAKPAPKGPAKEKVNAYTQAKQRLGKSGRVEDAAAALSFLMPKSKD